MNNQAPAKVLLVDDDVRNLRVLKGVLAPLQYDIREAVNGPDALALVAEDAPDIILLDVMMPGMTGFEVCRQLKSDEKTHFIPVVLVTALTERESKVAGVESGADDFINKPVDVLELRARVQSLLRSKQWHDELKAQYQALQEAERMRENLTQMIIHDMRNPLTSMVGYADLIDQQKLMVEGEEGQRYLQRLRTNGHILIDMVNTMMDLAKLEAGDLKIHAKPVAIQEVLDDVVSSLGAQIEAKNLGIDVDFADGGDQVMADREMLRRILVNIVGNATDFSPKEGCIKVDSVADGDMICLRIADEGPGIPEAFHTRIFEKFGQIDGQKRKFSTGLGLTFCKLAVEAHGGKIGVESKPEAGSCFWLTLQNAS